MPPPRASRLASRKSLAPDPHLYNDPLDSDNDGDQDLRQPPPAPTNSTRRPATTTNQDKAVAAATLAANTSHNSRRRSTRNSNEHEPAAVHDAQQDHDSGSRSGRGSKQVARSATKAPAPNPAAATVTSAPGKGKRVVPKSRSRADRERDEDDTEGLDESGTAGASAAAADTADQTHPGRGKRQKTAAAIPTPESEPLAPVEPADEADEPARAPARSGFKPRAVPKGKQAVAPKKLNTATVDSGSVPFAFSTNPPTPHVPPQAKRAAASGKSQSGLKTTRRDAVQEDRDHSPSTPRVSPPRRQRSASAPIHVAETPVQIKNIAFRQGDATPGTLGRSVKRSSVKGSGRRGSSIGKGFEAVPHPQVEDRLLYRSTDASEPVARRLRSILSWTAQRQRDRVFTSSSTANSATQKAAKDIVDSFISDICESRLDVSVSFKASTEASGSKELPPHPQNESNAAKLVELESNYAAIAREQDSRDSVKPLYAAFEQRRADARQEPLRPAVDIDSLTFDLTAAAPASMEEALALGRTLLQSASAEDGAKSKGKKKRVAAGQDGADELSRKLADVRLESAEFRRLTHQLDQFSQLASTYISSRHRESHYALSAQAQQGLASAVPTTLPSSADGNQSGTIRTGIAAALGSQPRDPHATATTAPALGSEPRDLLRAIASADQRSSRRGAK